MEYLQQLQDEVLMEDATLLKSIGGSQVVRTKHKKINLENKEGWQLFKKAKRKQLEKYHRDARIKMGGANLYKRCVYAGQDFLVYNLRLLWFKAQGVKQWNDSCIE